MDEDRLLITEEAVTRLGMGKHTPEVWRTRREGPVFRKLGGEIIRYRPSDLGAFVETSACSGGALRAG